MNSQVHMRLEQRRHVERVAGQQRRHKTGQVHGRVDSPQVVIGKSWLTPQEVLRPKRFRRLTVEPLSNTVRSRGTDADFDQLNRSPGEVTRNASTRHLLVTDRRHHPRYAEIRNYPTTPPQNADLHQAPKL